MSSETVVEALFLISAVIAGAVLISTIFPLIYRTSGTFGVVAQEKELQIRTDIKIVNYYATDTDMTVWIKNIGLTRLTQDEIGQSSIFAGYPDSFSLIESDQINYQISHVGGSTRWDPGETLIVTVSDLTISGDTVYFAIVLPVGEKETKIWDKSEIL